jgi:hypothetical protein
MEGSDLRSMVPAPGRNGADAPVEGEQKCDTLAEE